MKRLIGVTSLAVLLANGTALAVEPERGAKLGTSAGEISQALQDSGYELTKYEREGDKIEVYVRRGGRTLELKIDPQSGEIYRVEEEDS